MHMSNPIYMYGSRTSSGASAKIETRSSSESGTTTGLRSSNTASVDEGLEMIYVQQLATQLRLLQDSRKRIECLGCEAGMVEEVRGGERLPRPQMLQRGEGRYMCSPCVNQCTSC